MVATTIQEYKIKDMLFTYYTKKAGTDVIK